MLRHEKCAVIISIQISLIKRVHGAVNKLFRLFVCSIVLCFALLCSVVLCLMCSAVIEATSCSAFVHLTLSYLICSQNPFLIVSCFNMLSNSLLRSALPHSAAGLLCTTLPFFKTYFPTLLCPGLAWSTPLTFTADSCRQSECWGCCRRCVGVQLSASAPPPRL